MICTFAPFLFTYLLTYVQAVFNTKYVWRNNVFLENTVTYKESLSGAIKN